MDATISFRVVQGLLGFAEGAGVDRQSLLRDEQVEQLDRRDARVATATAERICSRAIELTKDPALGLHWSESLCDGTFAPVSQLSAAAPSLRHAVEVVSRFGAYFSDVPFAELYEGTICATIKIVGFARYPLHVHRFAVELALGGFLRTIRFLWPAAPPVAIKLAYPAPAYRAEYRRVFKQTPSFDQSFTGVVFDRALLDAPSRYRDDALSAAITPLLNRRMASTSPNLQYAARVRERLEQTAPLRVTMATVARQLGLSARTLGRRLVEEQVSYAQLENEVLGLVATQLLQEPTSSIKEVAHRMGFATTATFHRAFRRWTGATPRRLQC